MGPKVWIPDNALATKLEPYDKYFYELLFIFVETVVYY